MTSTHTITLTPESFLHQVKVLAQMPALAEAIATRQLIQLTAQSLNLEVAPPELQHAADLFRNANELYTPEDTFNWLNHHHLSLDDFEEMIQDNLLRKKVAEHLFVEKVDSYFYSHLSEYEQAIFYEIVFDDVDLALESYYAIQEKEISFPKVASQYIQDPELRRMGGYRGSVTRKSMKPEISAAVFSSRPPMLLHPVLTAQGSHLIFVEERHVIALGESVRLQIQNELFNYWLTEQSHQVEIDLTTEVPS